MGEAVEIFYENGFSKVCNENNQNMNGNGHQHQDCSWYEEIIDEDLKWSFALNRFLIKRPCFLSLSLFIYIFVYVVADMCFHVKFMYACVLISSTSKISESYNNFEFKHVYME